MHSLGTDGESRAALERPVLTRHGIVTAARKVIVAEGHEGLTLRRLGAELGVTAPALYAHFESKDEVLRAVAHAEFEWAVTLEGTLGIRDIDDPVERLREICLRFVEYVRDNREVFRLLMMFPPEFFRREHFQVTDPPTSLGGRVFRARAEAIQEAIEHGRLRERDPFLIGLALFTVMHGLATFFLMEPSLTAEFESQLVTTTIDALLDGLVVAPDGSPHPQVVNEPAL